MTRLSPLYELKRANVSSSGVFSGYASTFYSSPDAYGDVVAQGAFKNSIHQHTDRKTMPAMLWAHEQSDVIGKWTHIEEDEHGLAVEGKLTLGTKQGSEAHALMKDGALSLSIGFLVSENGSEIEGNTRVLTDLQLHEISIVGMPANYHAVINEVKDIRGLETKLRDALGFSRRQAKRIAAGGWPAMNRDDSSLELLELVKEIHEATNSIKG